MRGQSLCTYSLHTPVMPSSQHLVTCVASRVSVNLEDCVPIALMHFDACAKW